MTMIQIIRLNDIIVGYPIVTTNMLFFIKLRLKRKKFEFIKPY